LRYESCAHCGEQAKLPEGHVALEGLETALPGDATTAANADNKDTQYAVGTSTSSMGKVHPLPHYSTF
jgi:hypothetical protein